MSEELRREYEIGAEIGRGRFGVVRRCTSLSSGEPFAVKSVDKSLLADPIDCECAELEAKTTLLAGAGNPAVVQIHAIFEDQASIHLVMDLVDGPDLFEWIRLRLGSPPSEPEAADVVAQIAAALAACHRRGVAHRDVKPDNVLLDRGGRVRLADFGSAAGFGCGRRMTGLVGTPFYVAPEVVRGEEYGEKVDVWSAGVVMYVMLSSGEAAPFYGETAEETFKAVLRGNLRFPASIFAGVSPAAKDLMRRMMCKDVSRRFSAEQVLMHPWITSGGGLGAEEEQS
ncbi:phosphoenolpyruvate carboxylase kinase 1-like [Typha latifolia]|uniref:phosphoenolpyruvate carboxylase kinase 1-like n=1 Tax=Typha latifolia TaxID=4733 RepID=UPI003C2EF959